MIWFYACLNLSSLFNYVYTNIYISRDMCSLAEVEDVKSSDFLLIKYSWGKLKKIVKGLILNSGLSFIINSS